MRISKPAFPELTPLAISRAGPIRIPSRLSGSSIGWWRNARARPPRAICWGRRRLSTPCRFSGASTTTCRSIMSGMPRPGTRLPSMATSRRKTACCNTSARAAFLPWPRSIAISQASRPNFRWSRRRRAPLDALRKSALRRLAQLRARTRRRRRTIRLSRWLGQRVDDHRTGHGGGRSNQQGAKILFDPGERTPVCLLGACEVVEEADRRYGVVGCIDHIIGHEAFDIADDRNRALLDPAGQLLGRASLCLGLTDRGVHGILPYRRRCPGSFLISGGASSRFPRARYYAFPRDQTIRSKRCFRSPRRDAKASGVKEMLPG